VSLLASIDIFLSKFNSEVLQNCCMHSDFASSRIR
jgi:hypothetical protein